MSSATVCEGSSNAERLKAQGNALHVKGQYEAAYHKYSEAIEADSTNAVLYANRAASSLAMKEYLDAAYDARKAVELDPKYSKAWARLGTASQDKSVDAWENALSSLPSEQNLTPAQMVLKAQYEAGLKTAQDGKAQPPPTDKIIELASSPEGKAKMPWIRALAMEKELVEKRDSNSSAWVIMNAYRDFEEGVKTMKFTEVRNEGDKIGFGGKPNAITSITNGVLRDKRVFHGDSPNWFELYNQQVRFEGAFHSGWDSGGAKTVQEAALERLKTLGWEPVRRALSITIRAWMMRGYFASSTDRYAEAIEFYRRALDVLEWGRRVWKNVAREKRGVIFEDSFIRGIRRLYISVVMELLKMAPELEYTLEDIAEMAHDMIAETETHPPPPNSKLDPGTYLSFWVYPKADALSILGWYHMQMGFRSDENDKQHHFNESAKYYIEAAETFPEDDEQHAYFLKIALEAYWWCRTPLRVTLLLCKRIRLAIPKMLKIWELSQMSSGRDRMLGEALVFEKESKKSILEGQMTLDTPARPPSMDMDPVPREENDDDQEKWNDLGKDGT